MVAGEPVPAALKLAYRFWDFVCLDNVRRMIGIHRARLLVTGAAPISPDLVRWYLALGVPMVEVWGQTECCGVATVTPIGRIKPGTIGPAAPYNEVKLTEEGEILVRGDNVFMGYLNQPEKTAEALQDGWLHTGDVGTVDADGYFRITDRMKDIIITAGGKNMTPSEIENQLKFSPYITDAVVIGDKRSYLVALIMIDQENVERFAQDRDIPFTNYASLCRAAEVQALIREEIDRVNAPVRARRADQEVPADRAAAHRRGRGADADDEAEAQAREPEVRQSDRKHVRQDRSGANGIAVPDPARAAHNGGEQ